jgi:hypothetical protein
MTAKELLVVVRKGVVLEKLLTEAVDGDRSLSVVLNDLVISGLGTSTLDQGVTVSLDRKRIFANVDPPDVLDGASSYIKLVHYESQSVQE